MRNLAEYPITHDEIIENLESLSKDLSSLHLCGDIRPLALAQAAYLLKNHVKPDFWGDCSTPIGLAGFYEWQARGTGRTLKLVNSIPNEKVAIVVHSSRWAQEIKHLVQEVRPEIDIKLINFVVWDYNAGQKLSGLKCPVFFDNTVLDNELIELVKKTNKVYGVNGTRYEIP